MESKITARDFFLHLGAMIGLYASAIALGNLLFSVIDKAYPAVMQTYYYASSPNISFPVATLIIVFPIFIILSLLIEKSFRNDPIRKEMWIRRWVVYINLFVSGLIMTGDLVAVLYKFLDGQDLSQAFFLKALSVLIITGLVFGYYIQEVRNKIGTKEVRIWAGLATLIVLISIILGFSVIGSPQTQRLIRYDDQKAQDLQNIQWQIISIWQRKGSLPTTLAEVNDPISSYMIPNDIQSNLPYEYRMLTPTSFELCATFNKESQIENQSNNVSNSVALPSDIYGKTENWQHGAGRQCFTRTIDPELYPVTKPGALLMQ